ncbi:MAG: NAD(P)H-dependent glycerol-3-phosphate dehydrogenase [Clostridia bacterium]|nr:NAD(P)H-dependent glycerol-3-phosphate dehydrogenase [Clostridia bacterium]
MARVAVIGSGSWGTAIAVALSRREHDIILWSRRQEMTDALRAERENKRYLPGTALGEAISFTSDMKDVEGCDLTVIATPSHTVREVCKQLCGHICAGGMVVSVSKGFDENTGERLSEIIKSEIPLARVAVMSGPSHAEEVALAMPTMNVVASDEEGVAEAIQEIFNSTSFRIYTSEDVIGVELGGSIKNVIALASGILDGLGLGDNAKAALITRGIAEISRLGVAMGAERETFAGLSGIGDLIATCTSMHSRNRRAGILIGKGYTPEEAEREVRMVVEGVKSAKAVRELSRRLGVEMPISREAYRILFEGADPKSSVTRLMGRDARPEVD